MTDFATASDNLKRRKFEETRVDGDALAPTVQDARASPTVDYDQILNNAYETISLQAKEIDELLTMVDALDQLVKQQRHIRRRLQTAAQRQQEQIYHVMPTPTLPPAPMHHHHHQQQQSIGQNDLAPLSSEPAAQPCSDFEALFDQHVI